MVSRRLLFVSLSLALFTLLIAAQRSGSSAQTKQEGGIYTATLQTRQGTVKVSLPGDMAAGDTISGTVIAEPAGKSDKDKQRNAGELNGYVIELENQKSPVSGGVMRRIHLAPGISAPSLILLDEKGKQVATATIPVAPTPPTTGRSIFVVGGVGQTGRPIQVHGPFDGDSANTTVRVGGTDAHVLAESPRQMICESPRNVVGPTKIEVTENGATATGPFRNLKIDLTAPKTSLLKGESTELHVEVSGLEGISQPIPIQLQNQSPSTVNISGGNTQTIPIQPGQVQPGGIFTWSGGLIGTGNGGFTITGTLPPGIYFSPAPSPPPSTTQPTPSSAPSSQPSDTVVSRPANPTMPAPGTGDRIEIEMVELQLTGTKPGPTPSPTLIANEIKEPDVPKITEPPLRPIPSPTPTPIPTPPPRYVPEPPPTAPSTTPTIPGSGKRIIPKPTPTPPPPPPCECDLVNIKADDPNHVVVKVIKSEAVFEGQPKDQRQTGLKVQLNTPFIAHTIKCKGDPSTDPCGAVVFWKADAQVVFKKKGSNWSQQDTGSSPALALGAIQYSLPGQTPVNQLDLQGKCLPVKGGQPGCEVTKNVNTTQEFFISYPDELVKAIKDRKAGAEVKFGDIEITITWSVTVEGCKNNGAVTITGSKTMSGLVVK